MTVSLIIYKNKVTPENLKLWKNNSQEGTSSRLNSTKLMICSLAKRKLLYLEQQMVFLELRKQICLKMPFCKLTSKGCSRALNLRKKLTCKSEWPQKPYWKTNWSQVYTLRKIKSWKCCICKLTSNKAIYNKSNVCSASPGELMFRNTNVSRTLLWTQSVSQSGTIQAASSKNG